MARNPLRLETHTTFLMRRLPALLIAMGLMAALGCQPSQSSTARPTPILLTIQVTPALDLMRPTFQACAGQEGIGVIVTSLPASAFDLNQADLSLRWSAAPTASGYAAQIGQEPLALIVHPHNPRSSITRDELRAIYSSSQPEPFGLHPWAYPSGDDVQQALDTLLLLDPRQPQQSLSIAPDPAAMLEAVAQDPAAIGFLPAGWVNDQVRNLPINDLAANLVNQPILALSPSEPQGTARSWLLCVQTQLNASP